MDLQDRVSSVTNYQQLCNWVADSLAIKKLSWPLYSLGESAELGEDSTGGTVPAPYVELCRRGYLTIDSQDGFWDQDELQYSYVDMLVPQDRLRQVVGKLSSLLDEVDVYLNHGQWLRKTQSGSIWQLMTNVRAITLEKDDETGEFTVYSKINPAYYDPVNPYIQADELIDAISKHQWTSFTGKHFPLQLTNDLRRLNLQTVTVVMKQWGSYVEDGSGSAAAAVLPLLPPLFDESR